MTRLVYVLGVAILFALLGSWAGGLAGSTSIVWPIAGGCLGAWLGNAFAGRSLRR